MTPPRPADTPESCYTDAEYIAGIRRGDELVFTELVREYLVPLTRFAFGFTGVEDTAHDIVQDLFARIWQLGVDWNPTRGVAPYLFVAVRHRVLDVMKATRANQRMQESLRTEASVAAEDGDPYIDVALLTRVRSEIQSLTARQQEALRLRYEEGQKMAAVAAILEIDISAAERLIARALKVLRERLAAIQEELE